MRDLLIERIQQHGKQSYNRGYEWCSGAGPLGFALLDAGIVEHITLVDIYEPSIEWCYRTARENNLTEKVDAFVSGTIAGIPPIEKLDLVVSNPPHSWDESEFIVDTIAVGLPEEVRIESIARVKRFLLDDGMVTHKEFFANIRDRLSDDADLFIIEHDVGLKRLYIEMGESGGLRYVNWYDFDTQQTDIAPHKLLHFKPK